MASSSTQDRLTKWFLDNDGYLNQSLQLRFDEGSGQHFRAISNINASTDSVEVLCRCPFSLSLSFLNSLSSPPASVRNCSSDSVCRHLIDKVPKAVQSYFFLCEQKLLGGRSFWAPYIEALPTDDAMTTPWWFDDDDLLWLLGTSIHVSAEAEKSGVEMRRAMWKRQWEQGVAVLAEAGVNVKDYTWKLYLWVATIFSSRSFTSLIFTTATSEASGKESFALLYPVLDSFNHKFGAKVLWNMDKGDFELNTTEMSHVGEEVFNNYAPKGNEELLNGYGFCIEDNPCDEVALRIGKPPDAVVDGLKEKFPERFASSEWTDEAAMFFMRGSNHYSGGYKHAAGEDHLRGIPKELLSTISAILEYSYKQQGEEMSAQHLELAAIDAILDRLIAKYNGIKQYDEQLPDEPKNGKQKFAKVYRDGQLEILIEIIGELQEFLDQF